MTRPTSNKFYVEERSGGQVNASNLAGDLSVSAPTVIRWLDTFDRLYISWSIPPFTTRISRSLVRQRKYYLWDWSQVREDGPRFENMVAGHLKKAVDLWSDLGLAEARQSQAVRACHRPFLSADAWLGQLP